MKWLRFWQRARRDAELSRELDAYLEEETAQQIAGGKAPDEARFAATRKLGNVTRIREDVYERNSLVLVDALRQDLAYAWRLFRRNPAFTLVAIVSIAFGIGANTAVFTLLDQVMLRTLPVTNPERLVLLTTKGFQYGSAWGNGNELSHPMYEDLREGNQVFADMFCRFTIGVALGAGDRSDPIRAELVSGRYFPALGVVPALGRVLDERDDTTPRGHPVVVLSYRYWRDRLGSDPTVIGRSVRVNNHAMTVVGIAPRGFHGVDLVSAADLFVPVMMVEDLTPLRLPDRRMRWLNVFGRLRPGVTAEQAHVALQPFYKSRLEFEVQEEAFAKASSSDRTRFLDSSLDVTPAAHGRSDLREQLRGALFTMTGIGVMVLVIACANVANLLLARAGARRREIALRLALGASRRRIVGQLLVESVLLAAAGGIAGLLLATWGAQTLLALLAEREPMLTVTAWPDQRILAVNVLVSVAAGILFGLAPAWQSAHQDVNPALKADASTVLGGGQARLRRGLVVAQVMLSLLLLVAAGLFLRSLQNLFETDAGFDAERLLSFSVSPASHGYEPARTKMFAKALLDRVRTEPSVTGAAFVSHGLLAGGSWNNRITIEGRAYDPNARPWAMMNQISPGYFGAMGIPLVAGRDFDQRDENLTAPGAKERESMIAPAPPRVAIANEQFVKQYLNGREALGIHVGFGSDPGTTTPTEIVGVVATAKYTSMRSEPTAQLYFPYFESPSIDGFTMYVRTSLEPAMLTEHMRRIVNEVAPTVPIRDVRTVEDQIRRSLVLDRVIAGLSSVLAVLATLLAMVGLYGVMSYTVGRRMREIAIRMAFGAASSRVAALIVTDMLRLVVWGVLLALPAIWGLSRLVGHQLYHVPPTDPSTIAVSVGTLLVAACVAIWVPSARALRVNPTAILRDE